MRVAAQIMVLFVLRKLISGAKCLIFGRTLCLLPYHMYANSEGSSRLRECAGKAEPSLVAYVISTILSQELTQLRALFSL